MYAAQPPATLRLNGVTIVDTRSGALAPRMDMLIRDGIISRHRPERHTGTEQRSHCPLMRQANSSSPALTICMPNILGGPTDPGKALALMLAHGITGFSQLSGSPALLAQRRAGTLPIGPDAPGLLSMPGTILTPFNALNAADAIAAIGEQQRQGADFIKVALVTPAVFVTVQAEARRLGLPLIGHLPDGVDVKVASRSGMRRIEHLGPGEGINSACSTDETALRAGAAAYTALSRPALQDSISGNPVGRKAAQGHHQSQGNRKRGRFCPAQKGADHV